MSTSNISNEFLERWFNEPESYYHQPADRPKNIRKLGYSVEITAEIDKLMSPIWDYAKALVRFEPADTFDTQILLKSDPLHQKNVDSLILGVIDALIHEETQAHLFGLKVIVKQIWEHPVDSRPRVFRIAGWMIGKELLKREHELSAEHDSCFEVHDIVKTLDDLLARQKSTSFPN